MLGSIAHAADRATLAVAGQARAVRLADRRRHRHARRRPRRGPRPAPTSRRTGWPSGSSTRATSCSSSRKAPAAATVVSRRRTTGWRSSPCEREPRSCRSASPGSFARWPRGQKLPHPGGRVTVRVGSPFRLADELPAGLDRRAATPLATDLIMRRIAALVPARAAGTLPRTRHGRRRGVMTGPRAIIEAIWERSRTSASRGEPGSATASGKPSTRPRRHPPPARRRIPSARSSTTRASSTTSSGSASRPSRRSTTSITALPSSSARTASAPTSWSAPTPAASRSSTGPAPGSSRSSAS